MDTGQRRPACIHHPFLSLGTKLWRHDPRHCSYALFTPTPSIPSISSTLLFTIHSLSSLSILFPARSAGPYTYTYTLPYSGLGHEADPPPSLLFLYGREPGRGGQVKIQQKLTQWVMYRIVIERMDGVCVQAHPWRGIWSCGTLWNE